MATTLPPALPPDFDQFAARAGYQKEPDGRVFTLQNGKKTYVPPWVVWQNSDVGRDPNGGGLTEAGRAYRIPGSDPNSAWHFMYTAGGPFTNRSTWDPQKGTYQGSVDWLSLLTTIGAGGVIGAGIAAAAGGGAAAAGGSAATAPTATAVPAATTGTLASVAAPTATAGVGSTIASTAAPAAAAGGSWLTGPYASLIGTGANVFGQIYGANKMADASADAARIQAESFDKALAAQQKEQDYQHAQDDYKKGQFGSYLERLQPFQATGEQANDRLAQFMGTPRASGGTTVTPASTASLRTPTAQNPPPYLPQQDATVRLQAPDGTVKDVPAAQAPHFIKLGATPVGQGA